MPHTYTERTSFAKEETKPFKVWYSSDVYGDNIGVKLDQKPHNHETIFEEKFQRFSKIAYQTCVVL